MRHCATPGSLGSTRHWSQWPCKIKSRICKLNIISAPRSAWCFSSQMWAILRTTLRIVAFWTTRNCFARSQIRSKSGMTSASAIRSSTINSPEMKTMLSWIRVHLNLGVRMTSKKIQILSVNQTLNRSTVMSHRLARIITEFAYWQQSRNLKNTTKITAVIISGKVLSLAIGCRVWRQARAIL